MKTHSIEQINKIIYKLKFQTHGYLTDEEKHGIINTLERVLKREEIKEEPPPPLFTKEQALKIDEMIKLRINAYYLSNNKPL